MLLRTANPWKNPVSGIYYFRQKVPVDLVHLTGRRLEKISLKTKDQAEARRLFARWSAIVQERWYNLRLGPICFSHDDVRAFAEEFQRRLVSDHRAGLVPASLLSHSVQIVADYSADFVGQDETLRQAFLHFFGTRIQEQLDHTGRRPEVASKRLIDHAVASSVAAMRQTAEQPAVRTDRGAQCHEEAECGFLPTFGEDRSIVDVFEAYAIASGLAPSTIKRWRPVFRHLTDFVGHGDIRRLSREGLSSWRDDLARTRSPVTVRDVYLASLKAVLGWLVDEGRLPSNVAIGVKVRVAKTQQLRTKSLTDAEAATILRAALLPHPGLGRPHAAARRWVPWICAYTGARVNEITQLRRRDIRNEGGIWYFRITPEAGSVKTKQFRHVPVHPDLIDQGFLDFARRKGPDEMFYVPRDLPLHEDPHPPYKKIAERLAAWVRKLGITDEGVSPSHGWRHRFKTEGRSAGVDSRILDAIQGHAAASEGDQYGEYPLELMLREMRRMPNYSSLRR